LTALGNTTDEKLIGLALRIVLSDHVGIQHESEPDLLTEAENVFAPKKPNAVKPKKSSTKKGKACSRQACSRQSNRKEGCDSQESRLVPAFLWPRFARDAFRLAQSAGRDPSGFSQTSYRLVSRPSLVGYAVGWRFTVVRNSAMCSLSLVDTSSRTLQRFAHMQNAIGESR